MHKAINIAISEDQMTATMVIKKAVLEEQKELTYPGIPDVEAACEELGIIYGLDKDAVIKNIKLKDTAIVIAKGKQMVPSITDKVTYTFEDVRNKQFTPSILADDKANFYEMTKFTIVQKNELLVFIKKGRAGINGMTVTGRELAPEKYLPMTVDLIKRFSGSNTELSPEGVVAATIGIPLIAPDGKVNVDETYVVKGDVDFSTGSIDFEGPIIVKGSVTNNFTVRSPKDIIIEGMIDGGIIESEGMVTALGGMNRAKIRCKKNLAAKYIYFSQIDCESSVIADEAILNSTVKAKAVIGKGEPIVAKSGQISGGVIIASNFVWAKAMGSGSSNYTEIYIKSYIDRKPLEALEGEIVVYNQELEKVYRTINLMDELKKKAANLPPDFQMNQIKLMKTRIALEKKLQSIKAQIKVIENDIEKEDAESKRRVFITANLFSRVLVTIMEKKVLTKQDYGPSIIHISDEDGQIKITPATGKMDLPQEFQ